MKPLADLLGASPGIEALRDRVRRLLERQGDARRLPPVLIEGETGTGKGLLARMLHRSGPRPDGPFVDVNCAAIPETLLEAEMFGFERGAFTDARRAKPGLFQTAHRGTIFLDEVGLLPETLQSKLLKVLEERSVRRLGSTRDEPVDVWILTATNEDLRAAIRERRFREDLYHRLAVLTLTLPPLRARGDDVLLLAQHFLARACVDYGVTPKTLAPDAVAALRAHPWPGNVREVANLMERVALLAPEPAVTAEVLGLADPGGAPAGAPAAAAPSGAAAPSSLEDAVRDRVAEALRQTGWNISRTAALLGISRNTLRARIEKYGLRAAGRAAPPRAAPAGEPAPAMGSPAAVVPPAPLSFRWERRRVALLRALLVTEDDREDPPDTSRLLEVLFDKIASFGGKIDGASPSGIVAVFGLDAAEDAATRAAHSAMAILKAIERVRQERGIRVSLQLGIHVSPALAGRASGVAELDMDVRQRLWPAMNELVAHAEPNTILVSEAAAPFLQRRFEIVRSAGAAGGTGPVFLLAGRERTGLGFGARLANFVGRQHEIELLRSRLESVWRGQGQVIGIGGDPGIGKSRLVYEFHQEIAARGALYLEGHCASYGGATPYLPVLDLLRAMCGISEADAPEVIADRIRSGLTAVELGVDATPYLLQALGVKEGAEGPATLGAEAVKTRVFETLRQLLVRRSRQSPLVIVIEDLHWIDRTSEEFLGSLVDHVAGASVLVVVTYRSGYRPPWIDKSYATQMGLQPLAPEDSASIMRSVLRRDDVAEGLTRLILDRAEGNPFFVEELARAVGERRDLLTSLHVPETIQDVLLARIEPLPDRTKRVLQAASVIGREASLLLLRAACDGGQTLDDSLRELARQEFLYELGGADETTYVFKHALTREVAYESLSPGRRHDLHEAVGHALEALYADRLEEACDRLAYHYARTKDDDKAIHYLGMAAERFAAGYVHAEAVEALREARARIARGGHAGARAGRILDFVLREAHSLHVLGRFEEALRLLQEHGELAEALPDAARQGQYHFWLGRTHSVLGDHARTGPAVHRAAELARSCGDEATLGRACFMLAYEDYWAGKPAEGIARGREAIALLERTGERWWLGMTHWLVAMSCAPLGEFDQGAAAAGQANAIGEAIGDLRLQNYAAWTSGWIETARGEWERGIAACERALARSRDPVNTAQATGYLALAHLEGGDASRAVALLEQAVSALRGFHPGFRQTLARFLAALSEARLAAGQPEAAEPPALEALRLAQEVTFGYGLGLAQRALGQIAAARGDAARARVWLDEAVQTFDAMMARVEVARARLALAEVAHLDGDAAEADRLLRAARADFAAVGAPRWEARVRQRAAAWGGRSP